jgi:alkylated DNA repair dioxygenase AlkB
MSRMRGVVERPAGLGYRPALLDDREERALLEAVRAMAYEPVVLHGQAAKRTVAHFGYRYGYESWDLTPAEPLPAALGFLRERAAALIDEDPEGLAEALVTCYPPGAGIGWHRDAPMFGPQVVGVSLASPCRMRFQRRTAGVRRTYALELAPRSVYVLAGAARWAWQHSIPAAKGLRYSVTFRTVRAASETGGDGA